MSEETTLFRGTSSWVVQFGLFFASGVAVVAAIAGGFLIPPPASFALWGLAGLIALFALGRWILLRFRIYEITSQRLRVITGILTRRTEELELYRVEDVSLVEPFIGRVFGCGTLVLMTNDTTTPRVEIACIKGARAVREQLRSAVETCRDRKRVRLTEME